MDETEVTTETTPVPETEEQLLEAVLNDLDITYNDENIKKRIKGIMERGKAYLDDKYGSGINFETDKQARELLFSYCRYGRSNAIEQFEHDFLSMIINLAIRGAKGTYQTGVTDEVTI